MNAPPLQMLTDIDMDPIVDEFSRRAIGCQHGHDKICDGPWSRELGCFIEVRDEAGMNT
jgi:hypothetical protein